MPLERHHLNFPQLRTGAAFGILLATASTLSAGIYAGPVGSVDTTAINKTSSDFVGWASGYEYSPGTNVTASYQTPDHGLGTVDNSIVCVGRGGSITLTFDNALYNGDGYDFAIFENSFSDTFLELGYVEVSSDGENFVRFATHSLTEGPVGAFGNVDATDIDGFAGKYRGGYGTPFDLSDLAGQDGYEFLDLNSIGYVRIVDVIGDGSEYDSDGHVIYDPYPTSGSAGFDLDAVGAFYLVPEPSTWAALGGISTLALALLRRRYC